MSLKLTLCAAAVLCAQPSSAHALALRPKATPKTATAAAADTRHTRSRALRLATHLRTTSRITMSADQDTEGFDFGTPLPLESDTALAVVEEEVELTEKQKEIERLRAAEKFMKKPTGNAVCTTCGYKYDVAKGAPGAPVGTPFELLGESSWTCPNCKSPKAFFEPEMLTIAGFEDNQSYGFGTNTMTESGKSNLIFGGLAFAFVLLMSGYALN